MARIETIFLIHHSHTDFGYTHDQPVVWEVQRRFLDAAVDACEADLPRSDGSAFRWTVEATSILLHWLHHASARQVERFSELEKAGRIEVTAMFGNLTPLFDADQLIESFQPLKRLRSEYGFTIRSAMNCDVNGHNWTLADVLLDAGIDGFSMAINEYFGGAPLMHPNLFQWEAPSGRRLPTLNGWHYQMGRSIQIGQDMEQLRDRFIPAIEKRLAETGWPMSSIMVQTTHPFGDNGSADFSLGAFIRAWEGKVGSPHIRLATPSEWWGEVRSHGGELPVHRGDWTDFWNFGCISSARELSIDRANRSRLTTADQLFACLQGMGIVPGKPGGGAERDGPGRGQETLLRTLHSLREEAWQALNLWSEHTWGADISVKQPENDGTVSQWAHKAHLAYLSRSLGLLLQRDGVAELSLRIPRSADDALVVFNPLAWTRIEAMPVFLNVEHPRGRGDDPAASRHHQDRTSARPGWWLPPTELPACGYAVIPRSRLVQVKDDSPYSEAATMENSFHRLTFDLERGGVASWCDTRLDREIADTGADGNLGNLVYERVADLSNPEPRRLLNDYHYNLEEYSRGWKPDWKAERWGPTSLLSHKVFRMPAGLEAVQILDVRGLQSPVTLRVSLFDHTPCVTFNAEWEMGMSTHPESTYLCFPFAIPDAVARIDIGGQAMQPETDQIPGCCRDFFTVQRWVDLSNADWGVTIACPENPMVQFGGFTFGGNRSRFSLDRALFLGWVTCIYWDTNFRARQPGAVRARYSILPHQGGFDEASAHRFGLECAMPPVMQLAFEPARSGAALPRSGSMLSLPQPPILILHLLPSWAVEREEGCALFVRMLNASGMTRSASIGSGLLKIRAASECDLFGNSVRSLAVKNGAVQVEMGARRVGVVRLEVSDQTR